MTTYTMRSTFIDDMGMTGDINCHSSSVATKEENALWEINSMRRHDGLRELTLSEFEDLIWLKKIKFVRR